MPQEVKYWEMIAERLKSRGLELRLLAQSRNQQGERTYAVSAHRDDGKRYVFHSDEILTAFLELERFSLLEQS